MIEARDLAVSLKLQKKRIGTQDWLARIGRNHKERFWALDGVTFTVDRGETLGVIGANGSGKTTLLRVLAGIYKPHRGSLRVDGKVATLLTTTAGFQPDLTGLENIYLNGVLTGLHKKEIDEVAPAVVEFAGLGDFIDQPVRTYSSGMYARLGFALAMHTDGDVLLVDEVLGAGDSEFSAKARAAITSMLGRGATVVLVSHSMDAIIRYSDRVLWLAKGKVAAIGEPEQVTRMYTGSVV